MQQRALARAAQRGSAQLALLLCVAGCSVARRAHAQDTDRWLAPDKALHFGVSASLAVGSYAGSALLLDQPWQRAALAGGITLSLGAGKEIYDAAGHGDPSLRDFAWDVIGCAVGVGLSYVIDLALRSGAASSRNGPTAEPTLQLTAAQSQASAYLAAAGSGRMCRPYNTPHLRSEF